VSGATNRHGERLHFVHNWSWDPSNFVVPSAATDVLSGESFAPGAELELGAWDVRVLAEAKW
jgi:beta-galactosidase